MAILTTKYNLSGNLLNSNRAGASLEKLVGAQITSQHKFKNWIFIAQLFYFSGEKLGQEKYMRFAQIKKLPHEIRGRHDWGFFLWIYLTLSALREDFRRSNTNTQLPGTEPCHHRETNLDKSEIWKTRQNTAQISRKVWKERQFDIFSSFSFPLPKSWINHPSSPKTLSCDYWMASMFQFQYVIGQRMFSRFLIGREWVPFESHNYSYVLPTQTNSVKKYLFSEGKNASLVIPVERSHLRY